MDRQGTIETGTDSSQLDSHARIKEGTVVDGDTVARLAEPHGLVSATGPKGTVLILGI